MDNTVVGVYDSYAQAQNAMNDLLASGFARSDVHLNADAGNLEPAARTDTHESGSGIGNFFRSLFGMDEQRAQHDIYAEAVRRGSCVLTVEAASDDLRDRAIDILNRYHPVDIDERSSYWRTQGWSGYDDSAPKYSDSEIEQERSRYAQDNGADAGIDAGLQQGDAARIPVVEEALRVGKREVQRGGVRVFQRVRETPVQEAVQLREEHVKVERHAVDQRATAADLAGFKEGRIERREMAEEPVVSKTARVVEEVELSKEVGQRTEQIEDTVRRTEVEVEQLGETGIARGAGFADTMATGTGDDTDYRMHWQNAYGSSGGRYEDYDAAYRYGSTMAGSGRFQNYQWTEVEPQLRSDWETSHPESTWDKVKDAVRYGAERVRGSTRH